MLTPEELNEALDVVTGRMDRERVSKVFGTMLGNPRIYQFVSGFMHQCQDGELNAKSREKVRRVCARMESEDTAATVSEVELDLRFYVLTAMAFGVCTGYSLHELQAAYKPPQPRERTGRHRRK